MIPPPPKGFRVADMSIVLWGEGPDEILKVEVTDAGAGPFIILDLESSHYDGKPHRISVDRLRPLADWCDAIVDAVEKHQKETEKK